MKPIARLDGDLAGVCGLAFAGLIFTAVPFPDALRAVVLLPLVLAAPGYAVAAALFPGRIGLLERTVLTVALSVAAWTLTGLAAQVVFDLGRGAYLAIGLFTVLAGSLVAQLRRQGSPPRRGNAGPHLVPAIVAGTACLAIVATAIALASAAERREVNRAEFSALWIAPLSENEAGRGEEEVVVGVQNHEGATADYMLRVVRMGRTIKAWRIHLPDGRSWSNHLLTAEERGPLVATLFVDGNLYRRVKLEPGEPA